ncbi:restriction endonuclease subunit S [Mesorhizobium sp. M1227]|uniref:restriction endonuclease subunit S n=1 Tax=unclassified Mesorhizobium TaxID=325217 RepID=UPI00333B29D6
MLERPISKAGWTRAAFGDVVRKVNDKVDPWESGLERYVAGEHMDTDDLRIRRWGLIGEDYLGPAFHMRFKPGHVLYGSRRTYLRKVALADFEGITANTTFVLEAKDPAALMPELLPFLMQTEAFHSYSIKHSKGSVNPYINFSDLEAFEFLLPPIQEQARLVEVLSAQRSFKEGLNGANDAATNLKRAILLSAFRPRGGTRDAFPPHWTMLEAELAGDVQLGQQRHPKFNDGSNVRPYLRVANVYDDFIDFGDINKMHFPEDELGKFELKPRDILLNEGQSLDLVGRSAIYRGEIPGCCFQKTLVRFRCGDGLLPEFAQLFFQHMLYSGQFAKIAVKTTSVAHLTAVRFKKVFIPIPPISEQQTLIAAQSKISDGSRSILRRLSAVKSLIRNGIWFDDLH